MRAGRLTFGLSMVVAGLLASSAAFATPVSNVAGLYVPVGPDFITEAEYENLIGPTTTSFEGVGVVGSISDGGATQTYGISGVNPPPYLYDEFSGFTVDKIVTNGDGSLDILLKNGQLSYYSFATDQTKGASNILNQANASAAVALVETGSLWLSLTPQAINSAGDTLDIHLPSGSLSDVTNSSAFAYLDVVPPGPGAGPANAIFSCAIPDTTATSSLCPTETVDFSFNGSANSIVPGPYGVEGTGNLKAVSIPEPLTISLFGAGLIGAAALRRRKAKKA